MDDGSGDCVGILLAGGYGRRYAALSGGADKLTARLPDGRIVAQAAAAHLVQALGEVWAVVRPERADLAELLAQEGCRVLAAPQARDGMGASLGAAARALLQAPGWAGRTGERTDPPRCLVALADMPWLRPATIAAIARGSRGHLISAPVWQGRRGHPVAFAAPLWTELAGLEGDEGARALLRRHGVQALPTQDPGVLADVDTPEDLARGGQAGA